MAIASKKLRSSKLANADITVNATVIQLGVFEVTATVGQTSYTERHTIGADGSGPAMSQADLQSALDGYRQSVADKAAWQESMRSLTENLQ